MTLVSDLNRLYQKHAALYEQEFVAEGFEWINADDYESSVLCYSRHARNAAETLIVILNFTPVARDHYCIGVSNPGSYIELFNSDSERYDGSNFGNYGAIISYPEPYMGRDNTLSVKLPPLGVIVLKCVSAEHNS